jgi:hypothetical protein
MDRGSLFTQGIHWPITVFITILEQNRQNSCQSSTKFSEVNVKNTFTSHIDKKNIFDIFVDFLIFIHFHYMKGAFASFAWLIKYTFFLFYVYEGWYRKNLRE